MRPQHPTNRIRAAAFITSLVVAVGTGATAASADTAPVQAAASSCAQVEMHNVRPQLGSVLVAAFTSADTFGKTPAAQIRLPAGDAVMRFEICGITGESVALTAFQDLDSDGKMGRNLIGIPSEPWGASGTPGAFGPSWETGRVALDGKAIVVKLSQ